jgi:hypothetical protein
MTTTAHGVEIHGVDLSIAEPEGHRVALTHHVERCGLPTERRDHRRRDEGTEDGHGGYAHRAVTLRPCGRSRRSIQSPVAGCVPRFADSVQPGGHASDRDSQIRPRNVNGPAKRDRPTKSCTTRPTIAPAPASRIARIRSPKRIVPAHRSGLGRPMATSKTKPAAPER